MIIERISKFANAFTGFPTYASKRALYQTRMGFDWKHDVKRSWHVISQVAMSSIHTFGHSTWDVPFNHIYCRIMTSVAVIPREVFSDPKFWTNADQSTCIPSVFSGPQKPTLENEGHSHILSEVMETHYSSGSEDSFPIVDLCGIVWKLVIDRDGEGMALTS
jgi:hypothetical protein